MTDEKIIKALECCIDCKCKECPCYKNIEGEMRCTEIEEEEILGIINRQQAEIERLNEEKARFDNTILYDLEQVNKIVEKATSEAIKEFAERLKEVYTLHEGLHIEIDNIVKEKTEESNGE